MCQILKIAKSTYYYQTNNCVKYDVNNYEEEVISAFNKIRKIYGARKIKKLFWFYHKIIKYLIKKEKIYSLFIDFMF
ncbi:hypothetical protein [Spiroplasma endosymbiont of 'Nebria riversi']|uniref:hypothetical protein n=1 Tax=Spiroplasma endosymbiont of 'Nebria riversi' TaxID=2792084 RepID=UPI001C051EBC|nr:hypothetical protein [Spiroplasma endosymbiont of 'Nebria riversi']